MWAVRPNFATFAILGQVGNTISPQGKGPSQNKRAILVAHDQGLMGQRFRIFSSGLAGVTQLTVHATLPNLHFLLFFAPSCDHFLGEE